MIKNKRIEKGGFKYLTSGKGKPIVILHGLMGGLGNFEGFISHFPKLGYQLFMPELPIYTASLLNTNVKYFSKFINNFIKFLELDKVILVGNSLGGHVGLLHAKLFPEFTKALVLTGSSGLYENAMGDTYPKRGDYDFIKRVINAGINYSIINSPLSLMEPGGASERPKLSLFLLDSIRLIRNFPLDSFYTCRVYLRQLLKEFFLLTVNKVVPFKKYK